MPVLPRVGERFGRYRIDSLIGRGGMGVVFGATDLQFDRRVALKVVSASLGDSDDFRQRFEREASVLARLDSPHVIEIYDYGVEQECPYIATQYVGGGDLGALIRTRGAMPPWLALGVCAQVADALHDAHRVGVVHRDVKPANVLLRDADVTEPHAYLCDFGIARTATDGLTAPGSVAGTWSYLSPECGRGAPGTPSSDVYALGCLLWVALTGAPPYRGSDIEVAVAHQQAPIPQVVETDEGSRQLNEILRRTMAKDPADRYPDADQARRAMVAAAALRPAAVQPTPSSGIARPLSGPGAGSSSPYGPPPGVPAGMPSGPPSGGSSPYGPPPSGPPSGGSSPSFPRPLSLGPLPPGSPPASTRSRRRGLLVTAVAVVGVLVVAGIVLAVTQLGGGSGGGPSADPTGGPTTASTAAPRQDVTGDVNGDGLGDARFTYNHYLGTPAKPRSVVDKVTFLSDGTSFGKPEVKRVTTEPGTPAPRGYPVVGDFDGDGQPDQLMVTRPSKTSDRYVLSGDLSGGGQVSGSITVPKDLSPIANAVDLDGDGDDDLLVQLYGDYNAKPTRFDTMISDAGAFRPATAAATYPVSGADATFLPGDFNGDGRADLMEVRRTGHTKAYDLKYTTTLHEGRSDGTFASGGPSVSYVQPCCSDQPLAADIDGDGTDELLLVTSNDQVPISMVRAENGKLTAPRRIGAVPGADDDTSVSMLPLVSDVDGDGKDDVVVVSLTSADHAALRVALSNGSQLSTRKWASWDYDFDTHDQFAYFSSQDDTL